MPAGARWVANPWGMRQVVRLPQVETAMKTYAEGIASRARSTAPWLTGSYRDSIRVELEDQAGWDRPRYRVVADDYKSNWIEFGTEEMPAYRVLGQAVG